MEKYDYAVGEDSRCYYKPIYGGFYVRPLMGPKKERNGRVTDKIGCQVILEGLPPLMLPNIYWWDLDGIEREARKKHPGRFNGTR